MPTSPADGAAPAARLLVFADETGALGRWLMIDDGRVVERGDAREGLPAAARNILAVPGTEISIHWLALAGDLTAAQAAAAARLMLADAAAEPLAGMHVAVGRSEHGLAPAALVPNARMTGWIAALDADAIVPAPMLIAAPEASFLRRDLGPAADYRGPAAAFSIESDLAEALTGDATVTPLAEADFEAALPAILEALPLDLRQGPFAKRRAWRLEAASWRRIAALALALVVLTLIVQIALLLRYASAADAAETEAAALAGGGGASADPRPGFGRLSGALFEAIRSTPNVELSRIDYRRDGSLGATIMLDSPASLAALRARIEAAGLATDATEVRSAGGRPAADVMVRAS